MDVYHYDLDKCAHQLYLCDRTPGKIKEENIYFSY